MHIKRLASARGLVTLGVLLSLLGGCSGGGSGGGGSSAPAATTAQANSSVNQGVIGGTGLSVLSAQQATSSAVQNGTFTTTVSTQGPQLLFVHDSDGKIRGLTISLPSGQAVPSIMAADATSTALALLFLSPGVTTSNNAQAQQIFAALQQMTSFAPFLTFLQTNLPTRSLDDLVQDATYPPLLTACLTEWPGVAAALPPIPVASVSSGAAFAVDPIVTPPSTPPAQQTGGVVLTVPTGFTGASDLKATLSNYALRSVMVYEVLDVLGDGTSLTPVTNFRLDGAKSLKFFSFASGTPTPHTLGTNFSNPNSKLQYYIVGVGLGTSTATLPGAAQYNPIDEIYGVVNDNLQYLVLPTLDFATGAKFSLVYNIGTYIGGLISNKEISNTAGSIVAGGVAAATVAQGVALLTNQTLGQVATTLTGQAVNIYNITSSLTKILKVPNALIYVDNYISMPRVAVITEASPYDKLQFSAPSYTFTKTAGKIRITVNRNTGSNDPLTVKYTITDGTAIAGQDYTDVMKPTPGVLQFSNGKPSADIILEILDNPANTGGRQAQLSLGDSSVNAGITGLGKLDTLTSATLTIGDCSKGPRNDNSVNGGPSCDDIYHVGSWQDPISGFYTITPFVSDLSSDQTLTLMDVSDYYCCPSSSRNDHKLVFNHYEYSGPRYFSVNILNYTGSGTYPVMLYPQPDGVSYTTVISGVDYSPDSIATGHCAAPTGSVTVLETSSPAGARSFHVNVSVTGCPGSASPYGIISGSFSTTPTMTRTEATNILGAWLQAKTSLVGSGIFQ